MNVVLMEENAELLKLSCRGHTEIISGGKYDVCLIIGLSSVNGLVLRVPS